MPPLSFSMFTYVFRLVSIVTFNFYSHLNLSLLGFRNFVSKTKTKILYFIVRFFHFHLKFVSNSAWLDSCLCMYFFFIVAYATFFHLVFLLSCLLFLLSLLFYFFCLFFLHIGSAQFSDFNWCTRSRFDYPSYTLSELHNGSSFISIYTFTFIDVHFSKVLSFRCSYRRSP